MDSFRFEILQNLHKDLTNGNVTVIKYKQSWNGSDKSDR